MQSGVFPYMYLVTGMCRLNVQVESYRITSHKKKKKNLLPLTEQSENYRIISH